MAHGEEWNWSSKRDLMDAQAHIVSHPALPTPELPDIVTAKPVTQRAGALSSCAVLLVKLAVGAACGGAVLAAGWIIAFIVRGSPSI